MNQLEQFSAIVNRLDQDVPGAVIRAGAALDHLVIETAPADIVRLMTFLRDRIEFRLLIEVCGVDWPGREKRFDVVYHLLSLTKNLRLRVKVAVGEGEPIPSVVDVFPTANWFEREAFDMYGIVFAGHPDLRRILTDYGFEGHPLRKDFPLTGFVEVRYDDEKKAVAYKPVELVQEYRSFDYASPWEGPGRDDE